MNEPSAAAPPERTAALARFFTRLHRYRNLLQEKWWILVICCGLAAGAQYGWLRQEPPLYASLGRMIVSVKLSLPNGSVYNEEWNNFLGTQVALMQSDSVKSHALLNLQATKPELRPQPVVVQVSISPKTSIFNLRATGGNPEYVQAYLAAVMEEYTKLKKEMRLRSSDTTKQGIQEELVRLEAELQKGKADLVNYSSSNSVVFLQDQGNSAGNYLAALTKDMAGLQSELDLLKKLTLDQNLERKQDLAQQALAQTPSPVSPAKSGGAATSSVENDAATGDKNPGSLVGSESEYLKARQQILLLKAQQQELAEFLRPKHPKMIALDEDIAHKEKLLEIFRSQSQEQLVNRQRALELQITNLQSQIAEWEVKSLDISKKMSQYLSIKENNQRLQTMYDHLLTTVRTLDVDKEASPESVTTLEEATPAMPVHAQLSRRVGFSALGGLLLGLVILLILDQLDDRPTSFTELQDIVDETILGQIPLQPNAGKNGDIPVLQNNDERHALVEAYRNLRSSLIFMGSRDDHPRTMVLTSAIPNDGKSMTSANLAITLARSGSRVLLVDADLRRGILHKRLSLPATPGLAEVLAEKSEWTEAVAQTSVPNLFLLPRGTPPNNPGELFVTPAKDRFLKDMAGKYDYVLFDTPPVMAADDVSNLAPHVDGLIMVIRAGFTSGRVARAALDLLYLRKVKVIGVVFNAVRPNASEYYYYKYKEYYAKSPAA